MEDCVVISEEKEDKEDMSKSKLERIETMENELAVLKEEYKREQIENVEICGLTRAQWQRVIDEKFSVVVTDGHLRELDTDIANSDYWTVLRELKAYSQYPFTTDANWKHCKVVRVPGVRQPNFGEKLDLPEDTMVIIKLRSGETGAGYMNAFNWSIKGDGEDITEFVYY